ncbi:MAG: LysR family transcriptional regulator substrate-binding protein [Salinibacterium sp.]|nr:LysR family transcriptional regulator substrate-binding protein [Salinibacterium sp.]
MRSSPATPLAVQFVVGVTPGKWARVWAERMPRHPLHLTQSEPAEVLKALRRGEAHVAFLRDPVSTEEFNRIVLYTELPVVVAPKGHLFEATDVVAASDLAAETVLTDAWPLAVELVAANVGVAVMPQSVARALSRRDVIVRPYREGAAGDTGAGDPAAGHAETTVALVWLRDPRAEPLASLIQEFVGVVRGRTANSSRGG